jgi:transcriptional regulator NrdR family protein
MARKRMTFDEMRNDGRASKVCPKCGAVEWRGEQNSSVEYTRHPDGSLSTKRRRICQCRQYAFTTEEVVVPPGHMLKVVPVVEEDAA